MSTEVTPAVEEAWAELRPEIKPPPPSPPEPTFDDIIEELLRVVGAYAKIRHPGLSPKVVYTLKISLEDNFSCSSDKPTLEESLKEMTVKIRKYAEDSIKQAADMHRYKLDEARKQGEELARCRALLRENGIIETPPPPPEVEEGFP